MVTRKKGARFDCASHVKSRILSSHREFPLPKLSSEVLSRATMAAKLFSIDPAHAALTTVDVVARGEEPKLICDAGHIFISANPWLWSRPLAGAVGQMEVLEEEVASTIALLAFADEPQNAAGEGICIMENAVRFERWDAIWSRAVADGLDISAPFATKGSAHAALSDFAESLVQGGGVIHVDYYIKAAEWYELQPQAGSSHTNHFLRSMIVEDCVDSNGWL